MRVEYDDLLFCCQNMKIRFLLKNKDQENIGRDLNKKCGWIEIKKRKQPQHICGNTKNSKN